MLKDEIEDPAHDQGWWAVTISFSVCLLGFFGGLTWLSAIGWVTLPIAQWYDGRRWTRWWWVYAGIGLLAPLLTPFVYLWHRPDTVTPNINTS